MALAFRLASNQFRSQFLRSKRIELLNLVRPVTLKPTSSSTPTESHDERNVRLGRPQSPHLTIYKPQLTAILSISHRATGMVISAYAILLGLAAIVMPCPIEHYIEMLECLELGAPIIMMGKYCLAFPFTYHYFNGIRHLFWDIGMFLTIKEVYATGYIMLLLSLASASVLSLI